MTTETKPEGDEIKVWRADVAAATAHRREKKGQAKRECDTVMAEADAELGRVIADARENRVPWGDICSAAGLTRQLLDGLAKRTGAK